MLKPGDPPCCKICPEAMKCVAYGDHPALFHDFAEVNCFITHTSFWAHGNRVACPKEAFVDKPQG